MDSAVSRIHTWWHVCTEHDNDVCTLKRERKQTIKICQLHYIKEVIKSTLQTIIQWAYFQHLNTYISPYHRSSPHIMMNESGDKKTWNASESPTGPIATAGPVCAGDEGDYIWGFIFIFVCSNIHGGKLLTIIGLHMDSTNKRRQRANTIRVWFVPLFRFKTKSEKTINRVLLFLIWL